MRLTNKQVCLWVLVTGILFSMVSCNKSNVPNAKENGEKESTISINDFTSVDLRDAENPENPYDNFGREHFRGIVYVVKDLKGSVTAPVSSVYRSAIDFEKSLPSSSSLRSTSDRQLTEKDLVDIYQSAKQNFSFKTIENASPELKEEMIRFSEVFLQLKDEKNTPNYEKIKQSIVAYESNVLKSRVLSKEEKALVLKAAATSRYSALQWELPITKLVKEVEKPEVKVEKLKWYHWLIVVAADAGGAALGGGVSGTVAASKAAYDIINSELKKDETIVSESPTTELEQAQTN